MSLFNSIDDFLPEEECRQKDGKKRTSQESGGAVCVAGEIVVNAKAIDATVNVIIETTHSAMGKLIAVPR